MNKSIISFEFLSIALLLVLPNCLQTQQENASQEEQIDSIELNQAETMDNVINEDDATTRRYQTAGMIKLFIYPSCPYCQRVIASLRNDGNMDKVTIIDASIPKYLAELKRLTNGNTQCPFIFDQEKNIKMHESQDIIKYFKKRFVA